MTTWSTVCDLLGMIAGMAAFFLTAVFLSVAVTRKSSLAWINILFSLFAASMAVECLAEMQTAAQLSISGLVARTVFYLAILITTATSIPLYFRVKRHPHYDELQAANRELEYNKRLFQTFLDETPFSACVIDEQQRFVYVNSQAATNNNVSPEQMIFTKVSDWFKPETARVMEAQNTAVLESGRRGEFIMDIDRSFGVGRYLSYKFPLPGRNQKPLLGVVSLEITEELKSEAVDSLLAKIVELSPHAIYTLNEKRQVTSWNSQAEKTFGYSAAEITGKDAEILAPSDKIEDVQKTLDYLEKGNVFKDKSFLHVAKDGSLKHLSLSATKIKPFINSLATYAGVLRDESETRRAIDEMKHLNSALDARISALSQANQELPLARDQALEALQLRSNFAASMSHSIRTPLSGILGVSDLLLDKNLDDQCRETVLTIRDSATALLTIVNDILDISQLENEQHSLEIKPFNFASLVNDCVKLLQPDASNKKINLITRIDTKLPSQLWGDQARIRQVMLNLLGNAVKFTAAGEVFVEALLVEESNQIATVQFKVKDSGIGISEQDAPLLFTPFSRIEKSTRGIKGSGLGLAISKNMVELMRGKIDFTSRPEGGSCFWFDLPLPVAEQNLANETDSPTTCDENELVRLSKSRILIVEDSKAVAMLTMRQLDKFGIKAQSVDNGEAALEEIKKHSYDVILMDIHLPGLNGHDVTRAIRQREKELALKPLIIIAVTAGGLSADRTQAIASGMNDYLNKPVKAETLKRTLLCWLDRGVSK